MKRPVRLALALITLAISLALLGWSLIPPRRDVRRQFLEPTQMQLPTPQGFLPHHRWPRVVTSPIHLEKLQTANVAACSVLIL